MNDTHYQYGKKVISVGIWVNGFLTGFKFIIGLVGHSGALIADAVNSLSDFIATVAVRIGLKFSQKPKDVQHPYGHGKIESLVSLFIGLLIFITGFFLLYDNGLKLWHRQYVKPSIIALIAVTAAIISKEWLFRYTMKAGKLLNSPSIIANAWDHRSDSISSFGVFIGILCACLGWTFMDPVAAMVVAVFVLKMSYSISFEAFHDLIDAQLPGNLRQTIESAITEWNTNYQVKEIKGRRMGMGYLVDLHLTVDPYALSKDVTADFKQLERHIKNTVPHILEVAIIALVENPDFESSEDYLKKRVISILKSHSEMYIDVHEIYFHFFHGQQEIHFHMTVSPNISVDQSHQITEHIQIEIEKEFPNSEVIIHVEPAPAE